MAYKKGEVEVATHLHEDSRPEIILPHSCDEWVIGGKEEAEQMIIDLREAIKKLENSSK